MWGTVLRWKNAWRFWNRNGSLVLIIFSNTRLSSYSKLCLPFEFLPFVFRLIWSSWPNVTSFIPSSLKTSRKGKLIDGLGLVFFGVVECFFVWGLVCLLLGFFWGVLVGWFFSILLCLSQFATFPHNSLAAHKIYCKMWCQF